MTVKTVLEGNLIIWSNEGGHVSPSVQIGEHDLTTYIEDLFKPFAGKNGEIGSNVPGRYRITVEEIAGPS